MRCQIEVIKKYPWEKEKVLFQQLSMLSLSTGWQDLRSMQQLRNSSRMRSLETQKVWQMNSLRKMLLATILLGGGIQYESSLIEKMPMGWYIISIFAQILGSLR